MTSRYAKAYTEVLEILKYLPVEEYNKISKEEIDFYEMHRDKDYIYSYNPTLTLKEQNISREANVILVIIFRDFFATDMQKEKLNKILVNNERIYQEELREIYNLDDLFKDNISNEKIEASESVSMIEYKESFFTKILNKIKRIFHR